MAQVVSTSLKEVSVQAFGNWFTFKPSQKKVMEPKLASFLSTEKRYMGFVSLPDVCLDEPDSPEAKDAVKAAMKQGRSNIIQHLESLINNLEVSLQKDYDISGMKTDVKRIEGSGHLQHYKDLAEYRNVESSDQDAVLAEINKLKGNDGPAVKSNTKSSA